MDMAANQGPPVHILVSSLGGAVDHILPALDKWNPEIIYLFSDWDEAIELVKENIRYSWAQNCGPSGAPEIRVVAINDPYRQDTIQKMMSEFDAIVESTKNEFNASGRTLKWHVSITGGTNLMPVAMALSASTHLFPVYYCVPGDKYPELRATPQKLVVDIPMFEQLGPAVSMFSKSRAKADLFAYIMRNDQALVDQIAKEMDKSPQAIYPQLNSLTSLGLVTKTDGHGYSSSSVGRLAYHRWKGVEPS
jgi:hypothetical protein